MPTTTEQSSRGETLSLLRDLGVNDAQLDGGSLPATSPIDGEILAHCPVASQDQVAAAVRQASEAFDHWRGVPAPVRGDLVRLLGDELRSAKEKLGRLVTIEAGKIATEGLGEVQEMIDICTFAAGLSRQLCGLTIATERPHHRMMETWHPLGVTAVLSAFNFPVAVWSWNAALALVCGNAVIWKPSEKTPLTALAVQALFERAARKFGNVPAGLSSVLIGARETGETLIDHPDVALVSATGSTAMGRQVGPRVAPPPPPAGARPLRPHHSRTRRKQCRHRLPVRRSRTHAARRRILRDGHCRPALHHLAPPHPAQRRLR